MREKGWIGLLTLIVLGGLTIFALYYGFTHLDFSTQQSSPKPLATLTPSPDIQPTQRPTVTIRATTIPTTLPTVIPTSAPTTSSPKGNKDSGGYVGTGG